MKLQDGRWLDTVTIEADTKGDLIKKIAAVKRAIKEFEKKTPSVAASPARARSITRVGQDVGGHPRARATLDGKRQRSKPVYSMDRATVVEKLDALKQEQSQGLKQVDQQTTVAQWLDYWIKEIAPAKVRPHVLQSYRSAIRTRIVPAVGRKKLAKLEAKDVRAMHKYVEGATYKKGKEDVPYSTRSVEEAHNVLSGALEDAKKDQLVDRNVAEDAVKPEVLSESHGALTSTQARAVLLKAMDAEDAMVTRWAAGLMLGGRQGELLGLQWDRVDFERGSLDLCWQLEWLPLKPCADEDDPKRFAVKAGFEHTPLWKGAALTRPKTPKSQRITPLPVPLAAILQAHRKTWVPNPWNLVWVQPRKKYKDKRVGPIRDNNDVAGWKAAQRRAGIAAPVDVHAMRGTTATLLLEAKVDAHVIQSILGHSSVVTTRGYQQVDLTLARKALGNLDGLLKLPGAS